MPREAHHMIVIVGGGTAGITVAARLARGLKRPDIAIVEPSARHYYQPLWTLAGGGLFPKQASEREEADFIPRGATWIRDAVAEFRPVENAVITREGRSIGYDLDMLTRPTLHHDNRWGAFAHCEAAAHQATRGTYR